MDAVGGTTVPPIGVKGLFFSTTLATMLCLQLCELDVELLIGAIHLLIYPRQLQSIHLVLFGCSGAVIL